jgi:hypothetical protein
MLDFMISAILKTQPALHENSKKPRRSYITLSRFRWTIPRDVLNVAYVLLSQPAFSACRSGQRNRS